MTVIEHADPFAAALGNSRGLSAKGSFQKEKEEFFLAPNWDRLELGIKTAPRGDFLAVAVQDNKYGWYVTFYERITGVLYKKSNQHFHEILEHPNLELTVADIASLKQWVKNIIKHSS